MLQIKTALVHVKDLAQNFYTENDGTFLNTNFKYFVHYFTKKYKYLIGNYYTGIL